MSSDLKRGIVIVNEFSVPRGGKGTRGSTPGAYVERYMAREQATESLAPVRRLRTDDFIMRYMARESAVEAAPTPRIAKDEMRQAQGDGGVAFGYGQVSLSDQQLRAASADIQRHFDAGHTVLKTVLSFDEEYLRRHRIIDQDFRCQQRGDYRGHIDQMKLRMAIMRGLERMSAGSMGFDDLRYVGVIQVDTEHVHAHLAMVDAGTGHITADGTQRGKLLDRHRSRLRRGIDAWLDEKQVVAHLSSAVGYERRNVITYIKRWAYETINSEALPQFLLACLPADRRLWRAGTNDRRMRKGIELVTELVVEQLDRTGSPMPAAMEKITQYADERRSAERLSVAQWQKLIDDGRRQIIERGVNGVFQMLRSLPEDQLRIRTPMLDIMSMDYEELTSLQAQTQQRRDDPAEDFISFGFRLRSYASRLEHHREQAQVFQNLSRQWEIADAAGAAAPDSQPLYDFYQVEADYHRRLVAKYNHFLPFVGDIGTWYERHRDVSEYGQQLLSLIQLRGDNSLQRMKDRTQAERLGREIYQQSGGGLLAAGSAGRRVLDNRIAQMRQRHEEQLQQLRADLAINGLLLRPVPTTGKPAVEDLDSETAMLHQPVRPRVIETARSTSPDSEPEDDNGDDNRPQQTIIVPGNLYDFDDVKSLDLHHLSFDFITDIEIGRRSHENYLRVTRRRQRALEAAMEYLERSDQPEAIGDLPVDDVAAMIRTARELEAQQSPAGHSVLVSRLAKLKAEQSERTETTRSKATGLDDGLIVHVRQRVDEAISLGYEAHHDAREDERRFDRDL